MREIAVRLGVAKSSVSRWTRDIELTPEQRAALERADDLTERRRALAASARSAAARERRRRAQEHGRTLARRGDPLHQAGCMLFWAEGSRSRNHVRFTNSDLAMHRYFLRFLRRWYAVSDDDVGLSINCHLGHGLALEAIERLWLDGLGLPPASLRASTVDVASRASKGVHRPLVHGTARLSVNSTWIVQSIYGAIQEYAGFDRPGWLDLDTPSRPVLPPPAVSAGAA